MKFDREGWLDDAAITKSPNFYSTDNAREIIVMHYTAGYTASSAINTFASTASQASAHFVVDTDGTLTQMVSANKCAWHAGGGYYQSRPKVNLFSIGIEIVNPGYHFSDGSGGYLNWERKAVKPAQLKPFPAMIEAYDPWVGSKAFWPTFPEAQLAAVEQLTRLLISTYPTISDVVGHRDVDGVRKRKVDPGPAFPLKRFDRLLDDRSGADKPPTTMLVAIDEGSLNVRGGPGTGFEKLDWGPLKHGDQVEKLEAVGDWYRIRRWSNGQARHGWVYARYLLPAG